MKTVLQAVVIALGTLAAGCDLVPMGEALPARVGSDRQVQTVKYFGEEFADAHRALALKPAEEMPQAF